MAARAAQRRPPQAVTPRLQRGAAAVMAMIPGPSAERSSQTSRSQNAPLPPVAAFSTLQNSKVKWEAPISTNEDLNGRRVLPKASVLPKRSALAGSKGVPDTRASCAQTGVSGTFRTRQDTEEDEGQGDDDEVGATAAPAPGSPLLEHVSDDDGPSYDSFELESGGSPQAAEEPAAAPAASAMPSTAATSPSPSPSRVESPGLQAAEAAEENGDEEQGIELMMNFNAGNPGEDERELRPSPTEGAAAAEADNEGLGGEEEQGRELMVRMQAGGGTVSPAEEDETAVPPSPPSAAESDDDGGSSDLGSGEDENDATMSSADERGEDDNDAATSSPDECPPLIAWKTPLAWKTPKLTSAPVGGGSSAVGGGGGGSGGGSSRTAPARASIPDRSSTAGATSTVVHKPSLKFRSFTRFGTSAAAPPVPGASATGALPLSHERSPQPPFNSDAHQRSPDANTMPAPPNPPLPSSGPPQRVAWRTPRQTAAVPAAVTPTNYFDQQQQEQSEDQQRDEDSALELELPSEVVDALNPPAVRVLPSEAPPSTSWRQPARAVPRPARQQAQRHVVPPAASTSPPSSVSSAAASPVRGDRAEPTGRGSRPLPRFGTPFRPPDERDGIPQGQLNALSSNAARLAASRAAAVLPRQQQQRGATGRPEANGVPFDGRARGGERGRPIMDRRSTSSSSGPTSRESTSRSSSSSTNASRQRRPDYPPRDEFGRNPRDGHGRGSEGRGGHRDSSDSSNSSRNSSRTGPGGRMTGYHDRGDRHDGFGRDPGGGRGRGTGGYGDNRNAPGRSAGNGDRDSRGDSNPHRERKPEQEGSWGGYHDRRSEHNSNRSRTRPRRDRSRSPQR